MKPKIPTPVLDLQTRLKPHHKFLLIDCSDIGPGLWDQTCQLKIYLIIAYLLNLKLITPQRYLAPQHNHGKKVRYTFSDYFDINSITVDDTRVELIEDVNTINPDQILAMNLLTYEQINSLNNNSSFRVNVHFNYHTKHEKYAKQLIRENNIQGCIHIRRGDRLNSPGAYLGVSSSQYDLATRPRSVLKMLKETNAPANIYVMTDMTEKDYITELKENTAYKFMFLNDFEDLNDIREDNNYIAYVIELAIAKFVIYSKNKSNIIEYFKEQQLYDNI